MITRFNDAMDEMRIDVQTPMCIICLEDGVVRDLPIKQVVAWKKGQLIQDAFPELDAGTREQLITGIHSDCFDEMTGGEG